MCEYKLSYLYMCNMQQERTLSETLQDGDQENLLLHDRRAICVSTNSCPCTHVNYVSL